MRGEVGRRTRPRASIVVGTGELRIDRGLEPPFLVQEFVEAGEFDHKLYLVGEQVRGLIKPSPLAVGHTTEGAAFTPSHDLVTLARAVRENLDLDFLGVDILLSDRGPVIVDVNDFPGYRGIPDAARLVAKHPLGRLSELS